MQKVILCILDGVGIREKEKGNAFLNADKKLSDSQYAMMEKEADQIPAAIKRLENNETPTQKDLYPGRLRPKQKSSFSLILLSFSKPDASTACCTYNMNKTYSVLPARTLLEHSQYCTDNLRLHLPFLYTLP